jgi:uncharacterized protein DUF397
MNVGEFRTSTRCTGGGCVELSPLSDGGVVIRSTLNPARHLVLTGPEWADLLTAVKAGEFG